MQVAVIQGRVYLDGEGTIPVWSRGLIYGDGVFSTVRVHAGRPFALDEHLARLDRMARSARIRGVEVGLLAAEVARGIEAAGASDGALRVLLLRGGRLGGALERGDEALRVVLIEPWTPPPARVYREGVAVRLLDWWGGGDLKSTSYQPALLRLEQARDEGFDEVIGVSAGGELLEGATSNVFLVRGPRLLTPPLDGRILAGVTRARVLAIGRDMGLDVEEISLDRAALWAADEVFLTSSLRELVPVRRVGPREAWAPGETTRRLHRAFRQAAGARGVPWEDGEA